MKKTFKKSKNIVDVRSQTKFTEENLKIANSLIVEEAFPQLYGEELPDSFKYIGRHIVEMSDIDGPLSGGLPKAVELYVVDDIPDLTQYALGSADNGGGSNGEEFTFPSIAVLAGTYIYVASESTGFTTFFGFAPTFTSAAVNVNGDDAIELFSNGAVVDVFGEINVDGTGEDWNIRMVGLIGIQVQVLMAPLCSKIGHLVE